MLQHHADQFWDVSSQRQPDVRLSAVQIVRIISAPAFAVAVVMVIVIVVAMVGHIQTPRGRVVHNIRLMIAKQVWLNHRRHPHDLRASCKLWRKWGAAGPWWPRSFQRVYQGFSVKKSRDSESGRCFRGRVSHLSRPDRGLRATVNPMADHDVVSKATHRGHSSAAFPLDHGRHSSFSH